MHSVSFPLQSELAVHKKKLNEVETWIKEHVNTARKVNCQHYPFLVCLIHTFFNSSGLLGSRKYVSYQDASLDNWMLVLSPWFVHWYNSVVTCTLTSL